MPTTSNFGWTTPADTDLVKDGAAAIRTLGNGIDTSFLDLKGGTTGQVLSKASNTDLDFSWIAVDPLTILDAKGDLISATAADTPARLAVGSNGQILTADSTTSTGLKWAAPASSSPASNYAWSATTTSTTSTSYVTATTNVTVTTGTKAMVSIAGNLETSSSISDKAFLAFAVSGATTRASSDNDAAMCSLNNSGKQTTSRTVLVTGLTAGSNTFTLQIRTDNASATASVDDKSIFVMDMGS